MPAAIDTVSGSISSVGATLTAWTVASGDSLTVRNTPFTSKIILAAAWAFSGTAGIFRIRSPRMHDNINCYNIRSPATNPMPFYLSGFQEVLIPQDTLIAEQSGSAAAIDTGHIMLYYQDLPGIAGRFATPQFVQAHGTHILSVENTFTTAAVAGYQAAAALNAVQDVLKANTDYGLLGYAVDTACSGVHWRGADTGNLRVSGPGQLTQRELTVRWFEWLSYETGLPCIPIFNSANKAGITIDVTHPLVITVKLTSILVELH